jgi:hypothetical protein
MDKNLYLCLKYFLFPTSNLILMKKISLALLLVLMSLYTFSQEQEVKLKIDYPPNYQVNTAIDNMGYWARMAELGLVSVQPMYRPAPAKFTGTKVFNNKGILISDSPDVPVTTNVNGESENSIFGDPNDKMHVLESNNATPQPSNGTTYGADWYNSFDGGSTWSGNYHGAGGNNQGDPAACINISGRYFVGYINSGDGQSVSYSDDNGATWAVSLVEAGSYSNFHDKNHLWVDNCPTSPFKGNLYDGWMTGSSQVAASRSITNGTTWEPSQVISSAIISGGQKQGVNFKTGPNGEVYAAFAVYNAWPGDETSIGFAKSTDGGVTWAPAVKIIDNIKGIRTSGVPQNQRTNSFPSMACDISNGPYRGNLYVCWTNHGVPGLNTGNDIDCYMIKSSDGGTTWSAPIRINQDPIGQGKTHYFPWVTCDQANGYVSVVFYDNRNVANNQAETFMAYSTDGCNTITDMQVSDVSWTPSPVPLMATGYMGDYLGITAYNGRVYPTWTDNRLGYVMTWVSPILLIIPEGFVGVTDEVLNDTTYGNGNGHMDYGETELLGLTMTNTGTAEADSVTVTVRPNNPYVTMMDSVAFYGNFAIGQAKTILDTFKFKVADSIPAWYNAQFLAIARDKKDSVWTTTFSIVAHAPAVTIISKTVSDPPPGGNGNGRLDPGETATINIVTQNTGDYDAVNAMSILTKDNPYVSISNPVQSLGTLVPGQQVTVPFTVTVAPTAAIGSAVRFTNNVYCATKQHDTKIWVEKIGLIVEDFETGNFLKFPWQFPDVPWTICDSLPWEKLYCSQSGHISTTGTSSLMLHYNALIDDSISFHWRLRSQSLPAADKLKFFIDSAMVGQWSGDQESWHYSAFPVLAGPHTFQWEFVKNEASSPNNYASWLDFIVFPPEYITSAYAGGNASACAGLPYQLNGMAIAYDSLLWTTSGTGVFSNPRILDPIYTASPADIAAGSVNLTLEAFSALDHDTSSVMTLTFAKPPTANAGGAQQICAGSTYTAASSTATNYSTLAWTTSGDGTFDNPANLHSVYTPGANDILHGNLYLKLSAFPIVNSCPVASDSLQLTINALPIVQLGSDTTMCNSHQITLDPKVPDAVSYLWHPSGATTATLTVDSSGTGVGIKTISVDVTNSKNCVGSGTIHITFKDCSGIGELKDVSFRLYPNPNNGLFMIDINATQEETVNLNVLNTSGVTVYSLNNLEVSGFVSRNLDLGTLPEGTYIFRISKGNESTLKKFVIKK